MMSHTINMWVFVGAKVGKKGNTEICMSQNQFFVPGNDSEVWAQYDSYPQFSH